MTVYRIFDIAVACTFPLPGLVTLSASDPDWQVELAPGAAVPAGCVWFHRWDAPGGIEVMACGRAGDDYLLSFSGLAVFAIELRDRKIRVIPVDDCPQATLAHLLVDQVIPRVLCHQGRMVVHASAVELSDGRAAAFTGLSGQGKSTLATAFYRAGYRPVADDCLLLEKRGGRVHALASYPSLRLWPDSAEAMVGDIAPAGARFAKMAHYTSKKQLLFGDGEETAEPRWIPMAALYILDGGGSAARSAEIRVTPAGGMDSIMALIGALFALDVVSETCVRRNFETVREVVGGVAVKRLDYPRNFGILTGVIRVVDESAAEPG